MAAQIIRHLILISSLTSLLLSSGLPALGPDLLSRLLHPQDYYRPLHATHEIFHEASQPSSYKTEPLRTTNSVSGPPKEPERRAAEDDSSNTVYSSDASKSRPASRKPASLRSRPPGGVTLTPLSAKTFLILKALTTKAPDEVPDLSLARSDGEVSWKADDHIGSSVTEGNQGQDEVYFFWTWEAVVIVSFPVLCIISLLIIGFLTRTRPGVRLYRFLTTKHTFSFEISRRISLQLESPHVFRSAEAVDDQGEPKYEGGKGECVAVDLRYNSSNESFASYYDTLGSGDSFDSQYGSEESRSENLGSVGSVGRKQKRVKRKGSASSQASSASYLSTSRRGSQESQKNLPRLWGTRRKGSNDSQASTDSQISVNRRGSSESQRSILKNWYIGRKNSADSQISSDSQSVASRKSSLDSQRRQIVTDRHSSMDSSYGSIDSQGSKEGQENSEGGARTRRRDSPRYLESSLQEMAKNGDERRGSRTLSLIHEEPTV
ncbi:uncharacterized protein LOC122251074 [Penaeus japonicus]|uniref:uncharacterized protein LOC122251074 n=1 Tax=Penaeus japonicus TaxID=27405 RepID=UPI001C713A3F|nr:uncharacterized protein LOC122251074 [Penaeus japonicus]